MVEEKSQADQSNMNRELNKVDEDIAQARATLERYFSAFEVCTLKPEVFGEKIEERIVQILRGQDILELATPRQSFDDLVVNSQLRGQLETVIRRHEKHVDARLREWGLERNSGNHRVCDRDEAPLLMLFSLPSVTRKTFAAGAFAR